MKSDTRYSQFVKNKAKSGKQKNSGKKGLFIHKVAYVILCQM